MTIDTLNEQYAVRLPKMYRDFQENNKSLSETQVLSISHIVEDERNTLCIMPTGGGKSLVYWLSGLMRGGVTLVISPLIALIDEQADKLREQGAAVIVLHSSINAMKQIHLLKTFAVGRYTPDFIFVSPERMESDGFFSHCLKMRRNDIKLLAIDEVHCISQWGEDFRPAYKRIPAFIEAVFENPPPVLAMTATLNPKETKDICDAFGIDKTDIIRDPVTMRAEINLRVMKFTLEDEKEAELWRLLGIHRGEKTLVYVYRKYRKRGVEDLTEQAVTQYGLRACYFHGDMSAGERAEVIEKLNRHEIDVVFATNAFGMGIDIPDIRVVIHFSIPGSAEQYYQEIGRAARNKETANAYLLYSDKNIKVRRESFIAHSFPNREKLMDVYANITSGRTGIQTLSFFDDENIKQCFMYYVACGAIDIIAKGFSNLAMLSDITHPVLAELYACTKKKYLISTMKESGQPVNTIVDLIYQAVIDGTAKLDKPFDKCLLIEVKAAALSEQQLDTAMAHITQKLQEKYDLLHYFIYLLENTKQSNELHQEIACYLGADKKNLNKIYATTKGDTVRSKSEVIIANLLYANGIDYVYEQDLHFGGKKPISPDFTITLPNGRIVYWEHLGLLGTERYNKQWEYKTGIYAAHFPGQMVKTYEGVRLSEDAADMIRRLQAMA